MSGSEADSSAKEANSTKKTRFQLKALSALKELESQELWVYVEKLHELLRKNEKKIKKYKAQIKKLLKQTEEDKSIKAATPAEPSTKTAEESPQTEQKAEETHSETVGNFVAEIREAAEQAQHLNGFVYEPTSGLYYDQKTGYYYNAEYGLYYDGNTGCYYNYNQQTNAFEFHSQVQVPSNQKSSQADNTDNNVAADDDDDDNDDDDDEIVQFDEFGGVITDKQKLQRIRAEKRLKEKEKKNKLKRSKRKRKGQELSAKHRKHAHKSKKRKLKKRRHHSSEAETPSSDSEHERKRSSKRAADFEDGELSTSSSSESSSDSDSASSGTSEKNDKVPTFKGGSRFQDIAKKYPPSLRIIVQETNLESLKVGSLSLITYKGGSLGREANHDVIIPDVNVSKTHLKFHYDHKKSIYKCIDLGSRNGTVLNGSRMSESKIESIAQDLVHGSVLQIAQTKLLCHVHEGNSTCGLCEPGLLIETARETPAAASTTVALTHKEQLKKLQKKYGLENEKFVDGKQSDGNYNDRAATRRTQVGSTTDGEKTQTASVNTEISSENKGFKMLAKLGWNKGETLGKTAANTGLLEPINVSSNEGKRGLGCDEYPGSSVSLTMAEKRRIDTWKKTQARYQKADIFADSDDEAETA